MKTKNKPIGTASFCGEKLQCDDWIKCCIWTNENKSTEYTINDFDFDFDCIDELIELFQQIKIANPISYDISRDNKFEI